MKVTIVFAHPWTGSLSQAILDITLNNLRGAGHEVTMIDLYRDGFNPVMSEKDLSLYSQGKSADPMVDKYNAILDATEKIIFIFPVWWYDMPAIMRGFLDKVMLPGSAYTPKPDGLHPVRNIRETVILTTASASIEALTGKFGDPVGGTIIAATFRAIGFNNAKWHNLGGVNTKSRDEIAQYLETIPELI